MKYIHFKMTNPDEYIKSLDMDMKKHLELVSVCPSSFDTKTGDVLQYLVILKDNR